MDFTIYSIGSSSYLQQVLLAVVSIMGDSATTKLIQSGLLFAFLIFAFQMISKGGSPIGMPQLVVSALLYAVMFGPTADVTIEGMYDNQVHAVSDVPLGVAWGGSMISQVGYGLTKKFETAFSSPSGSSAGRGLTDGAGFADSLKMLMEIRRNGHDADLLSTIDTSGSGGSQFRDSWDNYIRECTAMKIDMGAESVEKIYRAEQAMEGLRFNSQLFGTSITKDGTQESLTCSEAFTKLETWTNGIINDPEVNESLARITGLASSDGHGASASPDTDALAQANGALQALSISSNQAQDYVVTSILEPIFHRAMAGRYQDVHDFSAAASINEALSQRDVQWASEQTIFMSIVRPMLTFIEGFVYSITPFMAFLVVLGAFGVTLMTKYVQMLLWIQLWLPVLAITNFFLYMVASTDMAQLDHFTTSFYELDRADQRLSHWVAVGGMLAAATPILTLVLITGSSYAMTSLAQRMQGADHVDEKQVSPDTMKQAAVMDQLSMQTNSQQLGRGNTGHEELMPKLNISSSLDTSYASSQQAMESSSEKFVGSLMQSFQQGESRKISNMQAESIAEGLQSSGSEAAGAVQTAASNFMESNNIDDKYTSQVQTQMAGAMGAGKGNFSIKLGAGTSDSQEYSISSSDMRQFSEGAQFSDESRAQLVDSMTSTVTNGISDESSQTWSSSTNSQLGTQAEEAKSDASTFLESSKASNAIGSGINTSIKNLGNQVAGNDAAQSKLNSFFEANKELKSQAHDKADMWVSEYGLDHSTALAAAQMDTMSKKTSFGGDDGAYSNASNELAGVISLATGSTPMSEVGGAGANAGLGDASITTPGEAGGGATASTPTAGSGIGQLGSGGFGEGLVNKHFGDSVGGVNADREAKQQNLTETGLDASKEVVDQVTNKGLGGRALDAMVGTSSNTGFDSFLYDSGNFTTDGVDNLAAVASDGNYGKEDFMRVASTYENVSQDKAQDLWDGIQGNESRNGDTAMYKVGSEISNSGGYSPGVGYRAMEEHVIPQTSGSYTQESGLHSSFSPVVQASLTSNKEEAAGLLNDGYAQVAESYAGAMGKEVDDLSSSDLENIENVVQEVYTARAQGDNLLSAEGAARVSSEIVKGEVDHSYTPRSQR